MTTFDSTDTFPRRWLLHWFFVHLVIEYSFSTGDGDEQDEHVVEPAAGDRRRILDGTGDLHRGTTADQGLRAQIQTSHHDERGQETHGKYKPLTMTSEGKKHTVSTNLSP